MWKSFRLPWFFRKTAIVPTPVPVRAGGPVTPGHSLIDHRQSVRRVGAPIEVRVWDGMDGADSVAGLIMNWSDGGVGVRVPKEVPVGTILSLRITRLPETVPPIIAEVRGSHPVVNRWMLNCRFFQDPSPEVLEIFP